MSRRHEIQCYEYVNQPYEKVCDALRSDAAGVFERATRGAAARASDLAASLRVKLGSLEVGADIAIRVENVTEGQLPRGVGDTPVTRIKLAWQAAKTPGLFPSMDAELSVYPLTPTETQLDLQGRYKLPLGALGGAIDAILGHRIAQASVRRLLEDVAGLLKGELAAS
jgi:hypothetical protein